MKKRMWGSLPAAAFTSILVTAPTHWHWAGDTTRVRCLRCLHYNPDPNGHSMVAECPGARAYVT
ncbi:hypothetical protein GCM10010234_60400 [Streptomyces hawaiiensis]|uniref:hypothetical protein n=1 Tax=Streptomyces hawaiiensis TaxID=67305 RepID=UPI0031CF7E96